MIILKNKIFLITLMLTIICSSAFLFSCGKKDDIRIVAGENGVVSSMVENGEKYYTASPDKWYEFVGWFDGYRKYSENPKLKLTSSTPKKLEARFVTTGRLSFDRILNSFYSSYESGLNSEGEYFNLSMQGDMSYFYDDVEHNLNLDLGGYFNFLGKGNELFIKATNSSENVIVYKDSIENGYIYVDNNGNKYSFEDIGIMSNIFKSLPLPSENVWNIENLLKNDTIFYQFEQYFGYLNATGIVESVINSENQTLLELNFQKLLNTLRNFYPTFEDGSLIKRLTEILIGNYQDQNFPQISLTLKVDYLNGEREEIDKIEIIGNISKDFILNLSNNNVILPKGEFKININNLKYGFSNSANSFDDITNFPNPDKNMLNIHLGGDLSFVDGNEDIEIDKYRIELDADLNPFALIAFKGEEKNYNDIEWDKLGFLSLRISLVLSQESQEAFEQYRRHKGATDYINLIIDTKSFGAKMLVYSSFYNPSTLLTTSHFFNNSYEIGELLNYSSNQIKTTSTSQTSIIGDLTKILKLMIDICVDFDKNNINQSVFDVINKLLNQNEEIGKELSLTKKGIEINVSSIRKSIRDKEEEIKLTFLGRPIKTDLYIFGGEEITKLVINFDSFKTGCVDKDEKGDYFDQNGESILESYNKNHKTVVDIKRIDELDQNENLINDLDSLVGEVVVADEFMLSDNNLANTYFSCKGIEESLKLKIISYEMLLDENDSVSIKFMLSIHAPYNEPNYLDTNISDVLLKNFNLPYGCYSYTINIK